jgi:Tol biopolymer transport system component
VPGRASNGWIAVSANPTDIRDGEAGDIYLLGAGGGARRIVGSDGDGVAQACPQFSPEGRRLAYGESRASAQPVLTSRGHWPVIERAVAVVALDDRGNASAPIIRLALPGEGDLVCPRWSPDGRRIAFRNALQLLVADAASGAMTTFSVGTKPWRDAGLAWSRDGSRIAAAEGGGIRVVPLNGGAPTLIPVDGLIPASLGWTAGDARIAYVTTEVNGAKAVRSVGADGTDDVELSELAAVQLRSLSSLVSPDGSRLVFVLYGCADQRCPAGSERLVSTDVRGGNRIELTMPAEAGDVVLWSPDGDRLLTHSIDSIVSVGLASGSPVVVHSTGELNLEWSGSDLTWQSVFD